jgi:hypothetical protein
MSTRYHASMDSRPARRGLARSLGTIFTQAEAIAQATGKLIGAATEMEGGTLRRAMRAVGAPRLPRPSLAYASACGLPRCECPSADLGEIRRVVDKPGPVRITFPVRNGSKAGRTYALSAQPIGSGGSIAVTPESVELDPGEIRSIDVAIDAMQQSPGAEFRSIVKIASKGCETLYLGISVELARDDDLPIVDLHCCCEPRMRPLRWYHHYYCDPKPSPDHHPQQESPQTCGPAGPAGTSA